MLVVRVICGRLRSGSWGYVITDPSWGHRLLLILPPIAGLLLWEPEAVECKPYGFSLILRALNLESKTGNMPGGCPSVRIHDNWIKVSDNCIHCPLRQMLSYIPVQELLKKGFRWNSSIVNFLSLVSKELFIELYLVTTSRDYCSQLCN